MKNISGSVSVELMRTPRWARAASQSSAAAMKAREMRLEGLVMVVPWPPMASRLERMKRHVRTNSSKRVRAR